MIQQFLYEQFKSSIQTFTMKEKTALYTMISKTKRLFYFLMNRTIFKRKQSKNLVKKLRKTKLGKYG
jgi:hypothetical protein